ncbi:MAG TPA: response regulator [Myxococcota bacterium]|nr:response regulator [Myxococcota bacterium]HRY96574.1 response regulator [Myxococcota bacterium]HSA22839.1 response regulator [Myxococcota bacterium]
MKILVIDDSVLALEFAKMTLESMGYEVETNPTPFGTQSIIQTRKPDVVLMDVDMPALKGDALCALIKKNPRMAGTRVVLYSSIEPVELARLAKECGADGFIHKTGDPAVLRDRLERLLGTQPRSEDGAPRQVRISLVDDSPITLMWVQRVLAAENYQVETCQDAELAEQFVERSRPDAILLDVNMPFKSGDAICRALKADPQTRGIPVILYSVLPAQELERLVQDSGADGYIVKNDDPNHLVRQLRALLDTLQAR